MVEVNYDSNALIIWGIMLFIAGIFKITYPNKFTDKFIKSNLNADLLSSIIFGVLLIIRAVTAGARLAFFDGVLTLMLGFLIYGIEKFIEENVSNRIWGMAFYIPLLLIGIMYYKRPIFILNAIIILLCTLFIKRKSNYLITGIIMIILNMIVWGYSSYNLKTNAFINIEDQNVTLGKKKVSVYVETNPDTEVKFYHNGKFDGSPLKSDNHGMLTVDIYSPGKWTLVVEKNNKVKKEINVKKSKEYIKEEKRLHKIYLAKKAKKELKKNNKKGIKAKLDLSGLDENGKLKTADSNYSTTVILKGITDPQAKVKTYPDDKEYMEKVVHADKSGKFEIKLPIYADNKQVYIHVLSADKTKENEKRIDVISTYKDTSNNDVNDDDDETDTDTSTSSSSSINLNGKISEDTKTGLVVATQKYIENSTHLANIKWPWGYSDYNIKRIAEHTYMLHGTFKSNGETHTFIVSAYTDDEGDTVDVLTSKIE